jgi:hypothetical protein
MDQRAESGGCDLGDCRTVVALDPLFHFLPRLHIDIDPGILFGFRFTHKAPPKTRDSPERSPLYLFMPGYNMGIS